MRRVFARLMGQAVSLGFGNVIDWVRGRRDDNPEGSWETMSAEKRRQMMEAAMNGRTAEESAAEPAPEVPAGMTLISAGSRQLEPLL